MTHAWCRDVQRDEAVRAAEDNRQGPLSTLEQCIETARAMMPKSVSATAAPEHENKGDGMRTERVTLEITQRADRYQELAAWDWPRVLDGLDRLRGESVRVVQDVAFDAAWADRLTADRDAAIRERDALKARVDYLERDRNVWALQSGLFEKEANALKARVADLESAPAASVVPDVVRNMTEILRSPTNDPDAKHAAMATLVEAVCPGYVLGPAASVAAKSYWIVRWPEGSGREIDDELCPDEPTARDIAELEDGALVVELVERHSASVAANSSAGPKSSEPDAWGVMLDGKVDAVTYSSRSRAELAADGWVGTVVPLYASPPPASGWLTEEEREALEWFSWLDGQRYSDYCQHCAGVAKALLARSSPPEVEVPKCIYFSDGDYGRGWKSCDTRYKLALAAAGVPVKEVGK